MATISFLFRAKAVRAARQASSQQRKQHKQPQQAIAEKEAADSSRAVPLVEVRVECPEVQGNPTTPLESGR